MGTLTARQVAGYFLAQMDDDSGDTISNLKIQKLVYYAQGFHLAIYGKPLFREPIVAWAHGPVVVSLYHVYSAYEDKAIPKPEAIDFSVYSRTVRKLLDEVWCVFGQFSAWKLRNMTHDESPWKDAPRNGIISHKSMQVYFKQFVN